MPGGPGLAAHPLQVGEQLARAGIRRGRWTRIIGFGHGTASSVKHRRAACGLAQLV